jgi:hypothetical protein
MIFIVVVAMLSRVRGACRSDDECTTVNKCYFGKCESHDGERNCYSRLIPLEDKVICWSGMFNWSEWECYCNNGICSMLRNCERVTVTTTTTTTTSTRTRTPSTSTKTTTPPPPPPPPPTKPTTISTTTTSKTPPTPPARCDNLGDCVTQPEQCQRIECKYNSFVGGSKYCVSEPDASMQGATCVSINQNGAACFCDQGNCVCGDAPISQISMAASSTQTTTSDSTQATSHLTTAPTETMALSTATPAANALTLPSVPVVTDGSNNNVDTNAQSNSNNSIVDFDKVEADGMAEDDALPAWAIAVIAVAICLVLALILLSVFLVNRKKSHRDPLPPSEPIMAPPEAEEYETVTVPSTARTGIYGSAPVVGAGSAILYETVPPTVTHNYGSAPPMPEPAPQHYDDVDVPL